MKNHLRQYDLTFAYRKAIRELLHDDAMVSCTVSAGFDHLAKQPDKQYQVFVKVSRYSDELLAAKPLTGGLLENDNKEP